MWLLCWGSNKRVSPFQLFNASSQRANLLAASCWLDWCQQVRSLRSKKEQRRWRGDKAAFAATLWWSGCRSDSTELLQQHPLTERGGPWSVVGVTASLPLLSAQRGGCGRGERGLHCSFSQQVVCWLLLEGSSHLCWVLDFLFIQRHQRAREG